jgi:hypothetical protein
MVGNTMVIFAETGDIICGEPAATGWKELGRVKPLKGVCWAPVAFGHGKIFARNNNGEAVCLDVK